jgi:hypothetical protein
VLVCLVFYMVGVVSMVMMMTEMVLMIQRCMRDKDILVIIAAKKQKSLLLFLKLFCIEIVCVEGQ